VRAIAQAALATRSTETAVRLAPVVAQHPNLLREFSQLFDTYQRGLTSIRHVAEVFAAIRVGLAVWRGSEGQVLKDMMRHLVGQAQAHGLGDPSIDAIAHLSTLPPGVALPAIPPLVAILADEYAPHSPLDAPPTTMTSGRHRHAPISS
jgi:hypothetical protein